MYRERRLQRRNCSCEQLEDRRIFRVIIHHRIYRSGLSIELNGNDLFLGRDFEEYQVSIVLYIFYGTPLRFIL